MHNTGKFFDSFRKLSLGPCGIYDGECLEVRSCRNRSGLEGRLFVGNFRIDSPATSTAPISAAAFLLLLELAAILASFNRTRQYVSSLRSGRGGLLRYFHA